MSDSEQTDNEVEIVQEEHADVIVNVLSNNNITFVCKCRDFLIKILEQFKTCCMPTPAE